MADSLPISGHIDPKSFPYLLVDLHRQGATGSLKVEGANHQKALYFRVGRVLFASSNDPKDQLGAILVESGKITEAQLEDVNQKVGQGNPLAKALSDSGVVSQRELSDAARAKVERILSDVISYAEGNFEFEDGVLPKGAVDLKLAPERLFIAAVRRVADRAFVLRHLDGLNVVLSAKPELREKLSEIESEVGALPDRFDGVSTLKDVASSAGVDEFDAAKIACGLLFLGLVDKGAGASGESEEASPFFMPAEEGGELDLSGGGAPQFGGAPADDSPSFSFEPTPAAPEAETVEPAELLSPPPAAPARSDETLMIGDLPSFSFADVNPPEAQAEPEPPPPPPPPTPVGGGTSPLKIIQPPKAADRTRPPQRPSKDDLAALDELLGKKSPEGPLTPIAKPADEWKPQFLPPKESSRGRKKSGGGGSSKLLIAGGGLTVAAVLLGGGYYYWTTMATTPAKVAAKPSPAAITLAPPTTLAATASPAESAAPVTTAPASPAAATSVPPPTTLAAKPSAPPATTQPAKPTPAPTASAAAKPSLPAPVGSLGTARGLLRKGQFPEAAQAFMTSLKAGKDPYALQILVACSAETLEKANVATAADDLFIVPVHYRGKDCYRVGWGVYDSEAKANAAVHGVPAYFREGGAKPKVVTITEITK